MGATMCWGKFDHPDFVLTWVLHGSASPADTEWNSFVDFLAAAAKRKPAVRSMVVTAGGGPNSAQRKRLTDMQISLGIRPRAVLFTDSAVTRGILTAIGWVTGDKDVTFLAPQDAAQGFSRIGLTVAHSKALLSDMEAGREKADLACPPFAQVRILISDSAG